MSTIDHREQAETNLTVAAGEAIGSAEERYYLAAAQVHATLYLGEQQRIANLFTFASYSHDGENGQRLFTTLEYAREVRNQAAEALGFDA